MTTQTKINWRKVKLGEVLLGQPQYGYTDSAKSTPMGPKLLRITDIQGHIVDWNNVPYCEIESSEIKKYILEVGDILFSRTGATTGMNYFVDKRPPKEAVFASYLIRVRADSRKCNPHYLAYFFRSPFYWGQINGFLSGSAQPGINANLLTQLELLIPEDIDIQKRIASTLSDFDDKIELNNKISKNLEQTAQTIFREWFVKNEKLKVKSQKFITKKIGEVARVVLGGTPSRLKKEYWGGNIPWINSGKANEFRIVSASENITVEGLKKSNAQLMPKRTTIIAITGATLGQVSLLEIDACANQSVIGIFGSELLSPEFIYMFIKNKISEIILDAGGGAQQHINKKIVENFPILIPSEEINLKFNKIIKPIFDEITKNVFENQKLVALRDLLLPKLMSGEIIV